MDSSPNKDLTKTRFSDLKPPLSSDIIEALNQSKFEFCTPVQAATIPLLCSNKDVAVDAETGSGKTLAFTIPLVEIIRKSTSYPPKPHQVLGVIISPIRELSKQIYKVAKPSVSNLRNVNSVSLVGGGQVKAKMKKIEDKGGNVLIGTPGMIDEIMKRMEKSLDFRNLEILVLDEADRLLDMGFKEQVDSILSRLPKQRRTGLFSATQTNSVQELAKAGLRNPVRVEVQTESESKTPSGLHLEYLVCEADEKSSQLVDFLVKNKDGKLIVYSMTCASVDYWELVLSNIPELKSITFFSIHGNKDQALDSFTLASKAVLLCTDVAARGLDIPGINYVVQFDPPQDPSMFIHSVGRTARNGKQGRAIVFLCPKEEKYVDFMRETGILLQERKCSEEAFNVIPTIRSLAMKDRAVFEKGKRAFVSFVNAYKANKSDYILRWRKLEIGKLGMTYGLLELPSMSEIKQHRLSGEGFTPVAGIIFDDIKFKDKSKEKQRQQKLQIEKMKPQEERREKGGKKNLKRVVNVSSTTTEFNKKLTGKRRRSIQTAKDDEDMALCYRLDRKLRKKLITEDEYERLIGGACDLF